MKAVIRAALAAATGMLLVVPLGITATTANWNDAEWVHDDALGTGVLDCAQNPALESRSRGTFLAGELLGVDLDAIAQLDDMRLTVRPDGGAVPDPANALNLGSPPPTSTFANPLNVGALGIAGVDLTGFSVGLPGAALGAANQWTQGAPTGRAAGASGLINDSGAVLVSDTTPDSDLPRPATIDITALLPTVAGLNAARLEVGAVAARSQLNGCAALLDQVWGVPAAQPIAQRAYGIAGLGLVLDAPAVGALTGAVTTTVGQLETAVAGLTGGAISEALSETLRLRVSTLASTQTTGTVTITGLDLRSTVAPFLALQLRGNGFTIDLANGRILVDLERLTGPLNNAAPNTQLVLNAGVVNAITAEAGALLDAWATDVTAALRSAIRNAQVSVALTVKVTAANYDLATVKLALTSTIGNVVDGNVAVGVSLSDVPTGPIVTVINAALAAIGVPSLSVILVALSPAQSGPALTTSLTSLLTTRLLNPVTTLGTTLSTLSAPVVTVLATVLNALPSVVSVMVNVQPDVSGAPPGSTYTLPTARSTAEYAVTALRLGLADFATPSDIAHVLFATGSAGPVTLP